MGLTKNVRGIGVYHHAEVCKSVEGRHDIASEIVRDVRLRNVKPFGDFRLREAALSDPSISRVRICSSVIISISIVTFYDY